MTGSGSPQEPMPEAPQPPAHPSAVDDIRDRVLAALGPVVDPELRISIVDLGLIYGVEFDEESKGLTVRMTLTTPACPYGPMLLGQAQEAISRVPGVPEARIVLVWDPPWDPRTMSSDEAKDLLGIW
jgi:metal-sulfur cluster biosynthetic enzyme